MIMHFELAVIEIVSDVVTGLGGLLSGRFQAGSG
jgi:hypothetical protein